MVFQVACETKICAKIPEAILGAIRSLSTVIVQNSVAFDGLGHKKEMIFCKPPFSVNNSRQNGEVGH